VEGFDFKNFKVYPNPTSTDFTIVQDGEFNYSLTTITGELISTGVGVNSEIVSMSNLAKGTYILTVNVDNQAQLVKIVKN
jgi:hypothetical protein